MMPGAAAERDKAELPLPRASSKCGVNVLVSKNGNIYTGSGWFERLVRCRRLFRGMRNHRDERPSETDHAL